MPWHIYLLDFFIPDALAYLILGFLDHRCPGIFISWISPFQMPWHIYFLAFLIPDALAYLFLGFLYPRCLGIFNSSLS
jgi:hypothetical protein